MASADLETAARCSSDADRRLGRPRLRRRGAPLRPDGHEVDLTQFADADLAAMARAVGAEGVGSAQLDDLVAVERWLDRRDGAPLVDAKVDPTIVAEWLEEAFRAH